jgi:uncharacterized protein YhaN
VPPDGSTSAAAGARAPRSERASRMRLERLDVRGYRRLRGSFEFAPGLTLVTGPNEAGKSTLHDALIHALFGFSREDRRRHGGASQKDARAPWGGGPFGLTLHARDREGRAVLVAWDFAGEHVELQDALTGESLGREKPKQSADYELGRQLVGMTRAEFTQVCCLHQEALATVRPTEELRASLQRAVESAPAEEVGVQSADERLRKLLATLGVNSASYRETRDGELQRLCARERALAQELDAARAQRAELDRLAARREAARERQAERARRCRPAQESGAEPSPSVAPEGDPTVARFRERRDELLAQLALPDTRASWNSGLLAGALALAALAALGAALVHPALAILLVGAAVCAWAARPHSETRPDPLAGFSGRSFEELDRLRLEEDRRLQALQAERLAERLGAEHELDIEVAQLRAVLEEREANLADPAELEVELSAVRARRAQLELTRDAVHVAREALRGAAQATHRRVAPYLNEALRRELPRITRGRYAGGTVDESLQIKLYAPESGGLVPIEQLSRGTRDQVALVQRLEIARLLDPAAGRAPLLLDGPFAHFDAERLRLGAELVAEVAAHRQVVLFTEDPEVERQLRAACPSCAQIELPDPVHPDPDAPQALYTPETSAAGVLAGA